MSVHNDNSLNKHIFWVLDFSITYHVIIYNLLYNNNLYQLSFKIFVHSFMHIKDFVHLTMNDECSK